MLLSTAVVVQATAAYVGRAGYLITPAITMPYGTSASDTKATGAGTFTKCEPTSMHSPLGEFAERVVSRHSSMPEQTSAYPHRPPVSGPFRFPPSAGT
jgi:hypothetical protein